MRACSRPRPSTWQSAVAGVRAATARGPHAVASARSSYPRRGSRSCERVAGGLGRCGADRRPWRARGPRRREPARRRRRTLSIQRGSRSRPRPPGRCRLRPRPSRPTMSNGSRRSCPATISVALRDSADAGRVEHGRCWPRDRRAGGRQAPDRRALRPAAIPPPASSRGSSWDARAPRVAFKATAGLHHPVRAEHPLTYAADAPAPTMHGFLNVFVAAAAAWRPRRADAAASGRTAAPREGMLEERDASTFTSRRRIAWRGDGIRGGGHRPRPRRAGRGRSVRARSRNR